MSLLTPISKPIIEKLGNLLLNATKKQLEKDGRKATGKGIASLETKVFALGENVVVQLLGEDYLEYQDTGRKPGKGVSKEGQKLLAKWVQLKGIETDPKKAKGMAFVIARNMKEVGMHSKDKRLDLSQRNFLGRAADTILPKVDNILFDAFEKNFNLMVDKFAKGIK
jgi:hypothetical protein